MNIGKISLCAAIIGVMTHITHAAISLSIDTFTSSQLTVSISGTTPATDTALLHKGTFILTPYAPNINTEWAQSTTQTSASITIGSDSAFVDRFDNSTDFGDAFIFATFSTKPATGTAVSGTFSYSGTFDTSSVSASDFELYLGLASNQLVDTNLLIAVATVPEASSTVLLLGIVVFAFAIGRRRKLV